VNHESATRSSRNTGLDRADVVDAALALVESGGPEALTMRRLAAEIGVATTSIYWHVGGRDDVIDAVIDAHGDRLAEQSPAGDTPRQRLLSLARHVLDNALAHPEINRLAERHGRTAVMVNRTEVAMARELTAAGLSGDPARDALRAVLVAVGGFVVVALRDESSIDPERSRTSMWARVEDPAVDPATRQALTRPFELISLFDATVGAIIDAHLQ